MTIADYRAALDAAVKEYESLTRQRGELDERIAQLAQVIGNLTRLCGLVPTVPWGLTDACRVALKAAGHPLTAREVRAQLEAMGFDLARYTNELAAIHTVLKRLYESGEAEFVPRAWDKPAYGWTGQPKAKTPVPLPMPEAAILRKGGTVSVGRRPAKRSPRR